MMIDVVEFDGPALMPASSGADQRVNRRGVSRSMRCASSLTATMTLL